MRSLVIVFLGLLLSNPLQLVGALTYPDEFITRDNRLTNIWHLASTERELILKLIDIKERHPDPEGELDFFLEFLLADCRYPFDETVESVIKSPVDRFKIVERFIYDWPNVAEVVDGLEVEYDLDVMAEFVIRVPQLPSYSDLMECVRELNEAVAVDSLEPSQNGMKTDETDFNTGNYLILSNISHALGHVKSCVEWADLADSDLVLSEEPFTIPGEKHWLHQYLVHLECLVKLGEEDKAAVIREEILIHYSGDNEVKKVVNMLYGGKGKLLPRDREIDACTERTVLDTHCYLNWSHDIFQPIRVEKLEGIHIMLYRGVGYSVSSLGRGIKSGRVLLDNSKGQTAVRVVLIIGKGTIAVEPGDALLIPPSLIGHVCAMAHGTIDVYSV